MGTWSVTSGVLGIFDDLQPLQRRIAPGRGVDRVRAERGGPLREAPVARWCRAERVGDHGYVVGVDAGNVAVVDVGSLARCKARHQERIYEQAVVQPASGPSRR